MSVNLLRNSRVFFTTNVVTTDPNKGVVKDVGFSNSNTFEIQVLDDISFSQSTNAETISLNEAGTSPNRSQRSFNTSLNPVEFSFTTYMRPHNDKTIGTITSITATIGGNPLGDGTGGTTIGTTWGPNTTVVVNAPSSGRQAVLTPQFNTSGQLIGFGIADGGTGYSTGALAVTVVDPDNPAETGSIAINVAGVTTIGNAGTIKCEESVLWNAMFAADAIGGTNPAWTNGNSSTAPVTPATCVLTNSNKHQLQRFGMIIIFDQNTYILDDCSLNQAVIDFGIDAIASIQWSGQARKLRRIDSPTETSGTWSGSLTGTYLPRVTNCPYIANKLTTVKLKSGIGNFTEGDGAITGTGKTYTLPITGGSITLTNNITYLTPANIGVVNTPFTYFTGSRSITGSLNAYLRTGTWNSGTSTGTKESANLFDDLIGQVTTDSDPQFYIQVEIGGSSSDTHVDLEMPACVLQIPTVNSEAVITTTVNFTAQSSTDPASGEGGFQILNNNEIKLKYYAA
jgi:hypothetical protein